MALKVKITTENEVVKVVKDDFLVYAETICYGHKNISNNPKRLLIFK